MVLISAWLPATLSLAIPEMHDAFAYISRSLHIPLQRALFTRHAYKLNKMFHEGPPASEPPTLSGLYGDVFIRALDRPVPARAPLCVVDGGAADGMADTALLLAASEDGRNVDAPSAPFVTAQACGVWELILADQLRAAFSPAERVVDACYFNKVR